jgi:hypothetical protein
MELLVPWLEVECLRDLAEDSSCESDCECESDLLKRLLAYLFKCRRTQRTSNGAILTRPPA